MGDLRRTLEQAGSDVEHSVQDSLGTGRDVDRHGMQVEDVSGQVGHRHGCMSCAEVDGEHGTGIGVERDPRGGAST